MAFIAQHNIFDDDDCDTPIKKTASGLRAMLVNWPQIADRSIALLLNVPIQT